MQYRTQFMVVLTAACVFAFGGAQTAISQTKAATAKKVGPKGVLHKGMKIVEPKVTPSSGEQKKKEVAERLDKAGLLYTGNVVVTRAQRCSNEEHIKKFVGSDKRHRP